MRSGWLLAVLAAIAATPGEAADAARRGLSYGPPPAWVRPVAVDPRPSPLAEETSGGVHYLLVDQQTRVGPRGEERFAHFAKRIVTEAGLEATSQFSVSYDPGYESVELHFLRLRRGGGELDRLARDRVELVQRESELEAQIYDGSLSAVLFIEDLRVGDVVEYAYTLRGANPVLDGRFTDSFDVEWSVPLRHLLFRLLWPTGRTLLVRNHGTSIAPAVEETGSEREYVWEAEELAPVEDAGHVPAWYTRWAWVQLSEFASWQQVAEWARPLYPVSAAPPPALAQQVEAWKRLPDAAARGLAALRFVQDEVRYVGIEMGAGSHRPSPPEVVAARRFGDCKDKSLLLTSLLTALGLDARPALVHSGRGRGLDDWLPTPYAFNHVVTRVELAGKELWLDPTRSAQGGSLAETYCPDFERALVVAEGTDALSEISGVPLRRPTEVVQEEFRVGDETKPVEYDVETRFEGYDADRIRFDLRRRSREEVAKGYLDYYAATWPGIRARAPLEVEDAREANLLVTRERYAIPAFWVDGPAPGQRSRALRAATFAEELDKPKIASHAPLAVAHPVFVRHVTRVRLPGDWGLQPEAVRLATPAVRFAFDARPLADSLKLEYEYQTLADTLPTRAVLDHLARLDEMSKRLGYRLSRPAAARLGGTNWIAVVTFALGLALSATFGLVLVRFAPTGAELPPHAVRPAPRASRAVLAALVASAAAVHVLALVRAWRLCWPAAWALRTFPDGTLYHPLWAPLLLSELVVRLLLLAAALALLALLARGSRRARPAFVGLAFVQTGLLFTSAALFALLPGTHASGLEPPVRDALLSLVPLVPGSALALLRKRGLSAASSSSRP